MPEARSHFTSGGVHVFPVRVYYEDTDAGGIVYHSNYLKFAERGRTEVLRDLGVEHRSLMDSDGLAFAVRRCEIDYLAPARLDDGLEVHTSIRKLGTASLDLDQVIVRPEREAARDLARLVVRLAVIDRAGRPTRMPKCVVDVLRPLATAGAGATRPADGRTENRTTTANKKRA
jgi:acyl-CoA thioester hydrolase